jgi:hypothetical protein
MENSYLFEIIRMLDEREISSFVSARMEAIEIVSSRYLPEIDLKCGFPSKPEYLDALRISWMLDLGNGKPQFAVLVRALGAALGLILQDIFGMKWGLIRDSLGEIVSMISADKDGNHISIPPFSYVEKRENIQDAEVFVNLFSTLGNRIERVRCD